MKDMLIVIDAYISNLERAFICERLISQIRLVNSEISILLLNKSGKSFGLEKKVEYYYNHGIGFMVGYPPQDLIDSKKYCRPYVYFDTPHCTLENWMPLINVTDHVANIYNSFVICSDFCRLFGFNKFLRVEFDTDFDINDLKDIFNRMSQVQDYLIYGLRKEGIWMGPDAYLLDVHVIGLSSRLFENFNLVTNDDEYWEMCNQIGYHGKWIEYVIAAIFRLKNIQGNIQGELVDGHIRKNYPKTKFDVVNSPGEWKNKWYEIPKLSKVQNQNSDDMEKNKLGIFFYNEDFDCIDIDTKLYDKDELVLYEKKIKLNRGVWMYDIIDFSGYVKMKTSYIDQDGTLHTYEREVSENLDELNCRMLMK